MTSSPDALKAFKNFAMSQSPPSYSPMRRRETQDSQLSQSGSESDADAPVANGTEAVPEVDISHKRESLESAGSSQPAQEEAATAMDDEELSEDGDADAGNPAESQPLPGVSVLQNANGSSDEAEEDDEMQGGRGQGAQEEVAVEPNADASEDDESPLKQEQDMREQDVREPSEQDESEVEQPQPDAQRDAEELEEPEEQPEMPQAPVEKKTRAPPKKKKKVSEPAEDEMAVDAASSGQADPAEEPCQALVPADPVDPAGEVVLAGPRSPQRESWGALPAEADVPWTVEGEFCSLRVGGNTLKLPKAIYSRLFVYQRQGVAWLYNLYQKGFGGILADEMGLGKTIQVAAFLACLKYSNQGSRFLLVVPPTLLEQWKRELKSWADVDLPVHVMHGTTQERRVALRGMLARPGALLTTYDLVRNCIDHLRAASLSTASALLPKKRKKQVKRGCRDDDSPSEAEEEPLPAPAGGEDPNRPWDVVIVDEGHAIKNPSCLNGRALRKLEARSRFLLTGTPLQNKLSDLWALMDFAQPGLLGNHSTFERNFSEQIAKGSKRNATRFAVELKDHLARELRRLTAPHFLRRLKDEVLIDGAPTDGDAPAPEELPPKTDVVLWLNLTNAQVELYNLYLESETVSRATTGKNGMEALRAISCLKKVSNHPLLCLPKEEFNEWRMRTVPSKGGDAGAAAASSKAPAPAAKEMGLDTVYDDDCATQPAVECQDFLARLRALVPSSAEGAALLSCKLRVLSVLLPQLQKRGHRCLIFSQSTRMLDLIQACVLRVLGLKFLRIDGTIDAKDRDLKLGKFQAPDSRYFCMCLSSQVGGVGLTITGADRVILCDPAWNPAMDAQAIDRVHRIGQRKDVVVYRLIGSGAIEDKMFRLQVFKKALAKTAMEQESQIRFFTTKDLKQLFEAPSQSTSTQSLMAEQLGTEALEHEDLLSVVAEDIGSTDDPDAMPFWQSSDVLGFSDYQRLFMYLEKVQKAEEQAEGKAKDMIEKLRSEEYVKDQVVEGKWRANAWKENANPQVEEAAPLADA